MDTDNPITAVIIDDHEVVSEGVRSWCAAARPRINLVHASATVADAWTGPGADADVVILDLQLGAGTSRDLSDLQQLVKAGRQVVVYTQDTDRRTTIRCITLGALAYVAKSEGRDHLVAAVHAAAAGQPYTPPTLSGTILADDDPARPHLAPREVEALRRWFTSSSKSMAARSLGISVKTLETYIGRVRDKYTAVGRAAPSKAELVTRTLEDRLFTLDDLVSFPPDHGHPDVDPVQRTC